LTLELEREKFALIDGISPPFGKLHPNMGFMGSWEVGGVP
jgi:hypothetical protein